MKKHSSLFSLWLAAPVVAGSLLLLPASIAHDQHNEGSSSHSSSPSWAQLILKPSPVVAVLEIGIVGSIAWAAYRKIRRINIDIKLIKDRIDRP